MDPLSRSSINARQGPDDPRWRRRRRRRPASQVVPLPGRPNPDPPEPPEHRTDGRPPLTSPRRRRRPRARRHPERRAARAPLALRRARTCCCGSTTERPGRRWCGASIPLVETRPSARAGARRLADRRLHLHRACSALGVPQASLDSFAPEFRQGMAARAAELGDVGDERPRALGEAARHAGRPRRARRPGAGRGAPRSRRASAPGSAHADLPGVEVIWRQDCYQLPTGRTSFGFKDGIGQPAVEGSGRPRTNPHEPPIKAGEFILGYPDETGELPPMPTPEVLGRNGTYVVFRKLHTGVAAYRQYLREKAAEPRGGGAARRQDGRPLAERGAARARPRAGRPRARRRPGAEQRLRLRRRPARASSARPGPMRDGRTRATRSTTRAASTSGCTA